MKDEPRLPAPQAAEARDVLAALGATHEGLAEAEVARQAADIVLRGDSFATIVACIEYGRVIFQNIRRFVICLRSCNVSEIGAVAVASALRAPLPVLALRILFVNLVTDVFPALAQGAAALRHRRSRLAAAPSLLALFAFGAGCRAPESDLLLVGTVERTLVEVAAPISEQLVEIAVERGVHVEAGARIARLDPLLAEAELAAARAAVAGAQTQSEVAQQEHRRATGLHGRAVVSQEQLDRARLARDEARAALDAAMARMAAAQKRRNDTEILAPVAGVVDQLPFDAGERVPAGAVVAVLLADGKPWVRIWAPERAIARLAIGTPAEIRVDGFDGAMRGRVLDVAREASFTPHYALTERERVHLVYQTRVEIDDAPAALRPGAPAEVRIALGAPEPAP